MLDGQEFNGSAALKHGPLAIVGGCGHVGLPLGMAFAELGHQVDLLDVWEERVAQVNDGQMPFHEEEADELLNRLVQNGSLKATTDAAILADADAVVITIGTPVSEHLDPEVTKFERACFEVFKHLRPGQLVVLRSTVFPGATQWLARRAAEAGFPEFDLAYCPERVVQGRSLQELRGLPQIVSGVTPRAAQRADELFRLIAPETIHVETIDAELVKLFCNAYRYINFAVANQFHLMAAQHGADAQRVFDAAKRGYQRMSALARPGFAAGPCLVKDTVQLASFHLGGFPLGMAAMHINEGLPHQLVQQIKRDHDLSKMTVGILGMAFKPDNDDVRDSLSYKLKKILEVECRSVLCTDPHVEDDRLVPLDEVLDQADLLIVGTPHSAYENLPCRQPVIDISGSIQADRETLTTAPIANGHSVAGELNTPIANGR